jgi:exosome complex exonuclease DIS3/RRP44
MSLRNNSFLKRTKKGTVVKVVKEHYLRDDISCGSPLCETCADPAEQSSSSSSAPPSLRAEAKHYLILDTNVVLGSIDALENPLFKDMIFLEVVLQEVKHRNLKVYLIWNISCATRLHVHDCSSR